MAMSPCALAQRLQLSQSAWGFGNVSVESLVPFQQLSLDQNRVLVAFQRKPPMVDFLGSFFQVED